MLYPFKFHPIFKERVWGGRNLERLYRKPLPANAVIGESWEISDRPGDVSVIANGPLAGKDLRWLMEHHQRELLGDAESRNGRFPLLIKILDAQDKLSLQVHPPASRAAGLGGEPKTEMWYIADAAPGAELFVGLKNGIARAEFERKVRDGTVADCFHRVSVKAGDAMFLPSGRVHAIGAGLVLFEVQQNSDTTYRVFDWNRAGLDGRPRELHVAESLASIDFDDVEPALVGSVFERVGKLKRRELVHDPLFNVELFEAVENATIQLDTGVCRIVGVLNQGVTLTSDAFRLGLAPGEFGLIPASLKNAQLQFERGTRCLVAKAKGG